MVAALLMLFATDSFAGPKPKEKHFYLDKEKQLYYEGMAVKKTPQGQGKLLDISGYFSKIVLTGEFDGFVVNDAKISISNFVNSVKVSANSVNVSFSPDTTFYHIADGIFRLLEYRPDGYRDSTTVRVQQNTICNPHNSDYYLKYESDIDYVEETEWTNECKPKADEILKFYGALPVLKQEYRKKLCKGLFVDNRGRKKLRTYFEWPDGGIQNNPEITFSKWGAHDCDVLVFPNGDTLSRERIVKSVKGGVVRAFYRGQHSTVHWPDNTLRDSIVYYNKIRRDSIKYDGMRLDEFPLEYYPRSGYLVDIRYSDGSEYFGCLDDAFSQDQLSRDKLLEMTIVPDSTSFVTGVFTSSKGKHTLYYRTTSAAKEHVVGHIGNGIIKETEEEFIQHTLQAKHDWEEYKRQMEEKQMEEQKEAEKEAKAREDRLVKTYGKYYTEFRDNGKILLGAPIKMFKEVTTVKLEINRKDMQVYDVWYGDSYYDYMYCEVDPKTGKITGTRTNPWN